MNIKNWFKKQFTLTPNNLKAIGLGFLWGIGITFVLGIIGIQVPAIGIVVWVVATYKYHKKFNEPK